MRFDRIASVMVYGNGRSAVVVEGLRINFKVQKTRDKSFNLAKIEVYNLSEGTRESFSLPNSKILLKAGYFEDIGLVDVFKGNIVRVYTVKRLPEVVTVVEALDGRNETVTKLSVGYPPGTSCKTVLKDLADIADFEGTDFSGDNKSYKNGFSFTGFTKDALTKVSNFLGSEWSVQNGMLKIISKGQSDNKRVQVLSVNTGLIESPVKIGSIDPSKKDSKSKKVDGWKVKHLLIPSIEPGNRVVIQSEMLSGEVFSVASVEQSGDTHGNEWSTTLEVQEMKGKKLIIPPVVNAVFKDLPEIEATVK